MSYRASDGTRQWDGSKNAVQLTETLRYLIVALT